MEERKFASKLLFMNAGFLIWAMQFGAIYSFNALACARNLTDNTIAGFRLVPFVVITITALSLAVTLAIMIMAWFRRGPLYKNPGDSSGFLRHMTMQIGGYCLLAIVLTALPVLLISSCY